MVNTMDQAVTHPHDIQEYQRRSPGSALSLIVNAMPGDWPAPASFTREHVIDEEALRGALGMAEINSGTIALKPGIEQLVQRVLDPERDNDPASVRATLLWFLIELHEEPHMVRSLAVAEDPYAAFGYVRHDHTFAAVEGVVQLAAIRFAPEHFRQMGLDRLDPVFTDPGEIRRTATIAYPRQTAAMSLITAFFARTLKGFPEGWTQDQKVDAVLARMISDGAGDRAMARMYTDLALGAGGDLLGARELTFAYRDIARTLDKALDYSQHGSTGHRGINSTMMVTERTIKNVEKVLERVRRKVENEVERRQAAGLPMPSGHRLRAVPTPVLIVQQSPSGARRPVVAAAEIAA
jgi:hypothetical protein